jgi:hypothetical protein
MPPLEEWWFSMSHDGVLPGAAPTKTLNTALTTELLDDAKERVPRLRDLSYNALTDFLTDPERIGVVCVKWRYSERNGWTLPSLAECRAAWVAKYGPTEWLVDADPGPGNWVAGPGRVERKIGKYR